MDWWALVGPPLVVLVLFSLIVLRRQRALARAEQRWGWLGSAAPHGKAGRVWAGTRDGRPVRVTWFGDNTEVEIGAAALEEVGFVRRGQPAELAQVELGVPVELGGLVGYARDRAAVDGLARKQGVRGALAVLLDAPDGSDRSLRAVRVDPGRVSWFARYLPEGPDSAEVARGWVDALLLVARASEDQPAASSWATAWTDEATVP